MLRLYRKPQQGEFFVVFGDCSQGGSDSNYIQFLSKSSQDFPMVIKMQDVAAAMTPVLHQALEWLFDQTKVKPVVALERNNGGASEMERLRLMNRSDKYKLYYMKRDGIVTDKLGFITDAVSRPKMIGDWKVAFDTTQFNIYDEETIQQHRTFITNKRDRPEAAPNTHDDAVMSCAGAYQLYLTENPPAKPIRTRQRPKRARMHL